MIHLLIADVNLMVRIGKVLRDSIQTNIEVVQRESLSALLFIFYLAHVIKPISLETTREDHSNEIIWSELDWII